MASWADNLVVKAKWSWRDWLKFCGIMLYWSVVAVVAVFDIVMFLFIFVNGLHPPYVP